MDKHPKRQIIEEQAELQEIEVILIDGFDEAILGLVCVRPDEAPVVAYSVKGILEKLMQDGCDLDEAYSYYGHNIERSYLGSETPVFVEDDFGCANPKKPQESKS